MTALYVASHNGHVELIKSLLQNGAYVDVQEEVSFTFSYSTNLLVKLKRQCKNVTMIYLAQILFVQKKWTPLMIACQNGHVDVVNMLLQHGASVHLPNKVT